MGGREKIGNGNREGREGVGKGKGKRRGREGRGREYMQIKTCRTQKLLFKTTLISALHGYWLVPR